MKIKIDEEIKYINTNFVIDGLFAFLVSIFQ